MKLLNTKEKQEFYKALFQLDIEPAIHTQCCDDDPTQPNTCEGCGLATAQKNLDNGIPVVLENFGRRTEDGDYKVSFGTFFLTDIIMVYVPGEKIDPEYLKKCRELNRERQIDVTPLTQRLSAEEKERRRKLHVEEMVKNLLD